MSVWRALKIQTCGSFLLLFLGACSPALTVETSTEDRGGELEVLVPKDGEKIGEGNDPLCPTSLKYCYKIRAEGRVPEGSYPFFGVGPVLASPKIWIQPLIGRVRKDGTFSGLIYLGEQNNGAGKFFKIYVLACKDKDSLDDGDEILELPKDCQVSDPVEVYRTR